MDIQGSTCPQTKKGPSIHKGADIPNNRMGKATGNKPKGMKYKLYMGRYQYHASIKILTHKPSELQDKPNGGHGQDMTTLKDYNCKPLQQ